MKNDGKIYPILLNYILQDFKTMNTALPYIIILLLANFSHQPKLMVFHWSLSDSKSL